MVYVGILYIYVWDAGCLGLSYSFMLCCSENVTSHTYIIGREVDGVTNCKISVWFGFKMVLYANFYRKHLELKFCLKH